MLIRPLTFRQLVLYVATHNHLERSLGLNTYPRTLPDALREALEQSILPAVADAGSSFHYSTLWTIIEKQERRMVGDLCFKGTPDAQGVLEIGYGTYADFQGKGFMTEALGAMVEWAFRQPGVSRIRAETDQANIASHKILARNAFTVCRQEGDMIWWERVRP